MVEIEINGKRYEAEDGAMIIEIADREGIHIPRFCYHKKLSVAANCRMCLVEVEKAPKPMPACATPVMDGMKVHTASKYATDAQKAVMEFLLINHPLDCPICDQGGECELQDVAMGNGGDVSHYDQAKRAVKDEDIGSLVETEMTRCIHCTRCIRFGEEVAGLRELGMTHRGEHSKVATYVKHALQSEVSGNIIDLCPVGALTSKPFRFQARSWEMQQHASIAPHDCLGSNLYVHTRRDEVLRIVPKTNEAINETWLSDRDRFSYEALRADKRLTTPMIKQNGKWHACNWQTAFDHAVTGLQGIIKNYDAKQIGGLISPSATLEEHYLFQKLLRELGTSHIDHRLRHLDFSDQDQQPMHPTLGVGLQGLENLDVAVLVGVNVQQAQPLVAIRLRKAALAGGKIHLISPLDLAVNFEPASRTTVSPQQMIAELAGIAKALLALNTQHKLLEQHVKLLGAVNPNEQQTAIANQLLQAKNGAVILGEIANHHQHAADLRLLARMIASLAHCEHGVLTDGANTAGACLAGTLPHRIASGQGDPQPGMHAHAMLQQNLKAYVCFNLEPSLDSADSHLIMNALKQAKFVLAFSTMLTDDLAETADVVLPISTVYETSGTFVNVEGTWQSFNGCVKPYGESRPGWKVLRVLANQLELNGFEYEDSHQVRDELRQLVDEAQLMARPTPWYTPEKLVLAPMADLERVSEWPIYSVDNLVRQAPALQLCDYAQKNNLRLNKKLATDLAIQDGATVLIKQGDAQQSMVAMIDNTVADNCVYIPAGVTASMGLGPISGMLTIENNGS